MLSPCETLAKEEEIAAKLAQVGFPGDPVVKSTPANAGDTVREDPTGQGATEPMCLEPILPNKRGRHSEKPEHCNYRGAFARCNKRKPPWPQRPSAAKNT